MSAKKGKSNGDFAPPSDLKWINRNLTDDEKSHHDTQQKKPGDLGILLFKVVNQGYNVRVAWDSWSKCYQANLIPFQPENPNFGYAISARGTTAERAVSLVLYKHYAVFQENWAAHHTPSSSSREG